MFIESADNITGADEVDCFILLCMQKSPLVFEIGTKGAGIGGLYLAGIAKVEAVCSNEGKGDFGHENDRG